MKTLSFQSRKEGERRRHADWEAPNTSAGAMGPRHLLREWVEEDLQLAVFIRDVFHCTLQQPLALSTLLFLPPHLSSSSIGEFSKCANRWTIQPEIWVLSPSLSHYFAAGSWGEEALNGSPGAFGLSESRHKIFQSPPLEMPHLLVNLSHSDF